MTDRTRSIACMVLLALAACACSRGTDTPPAESRDVPRTLGGPVVAPLADDTSDQIVSWVDGQAVTDWAAEIAKRERAIEQYLNDTDPARAEQYGFRERPESAAGLELVPRQPGRLQRRAVRACSRRCSISIPTMPNPTLRTIARIWKREAIVPVPGGSPASRWTLDHLGVGPDPIDYVDGVARPPSERQSPLPYGFAFENPRTFEPLSAAETQVYNGRLLARRMFQNTSLLVAKLRTSDTEENWERDRPGFGSPGTMDRVFLSCAACHVGPRRGGRENEVPARDAQHGNRGTGTTRSC